MRKILLISITVLICLLVYFFIDYNIYVDVHVSNNIVEINSEHKVSEFIDKILNASLVDGNEIVTFSKLGEANVPIKVKNNFGKVYMQEIKINVVDRVSPVIECHNIDSYIHDEINLLDNIKVTDNSNEQIIPIIEGNYDFNKKGNYQLNVKAIDSSNNISECNFTLNVKDKIVKQDDSKYYIKLDKKNNVLMIYSIDLNGNYNNLEKVFVISAGKNTPVGTFKIKDRHDYISFSSGTWGRYGIRINGPYWFHSVPYKELPKEGHWNSIISKEYNKLGSLASAGCIRLAVSDVKWLYDNIPKGTIVDIYEGEKLPEGVIKPESKKIEVGSIYDGWDPTDIDKTNPWNNN